MKRFNILVGLLFILVSNSMLSPSFANADDCSIAVITNINNHLIITIPYSNYEGEVVFKKNEKRNPEIISSYGKCKNGEELRFRVTDCTDRIFYEFPALPNRTDKGLPLYIIKYPYNNNYKTLKKRFLCKKRNF